MRIGRGSLPEDLQVIVLIEGRTRELRDYMELENEAPEYKSAQVGNFRRAPVRDGHVAGRGDGG